MTAADLGIRFVAPAGRPTHAGTRALDVLSAVGLAPSLDVGTAIGFLGWDEYSSSRSFLDGLALVPPRLEIHRRPDGSLGTPPCAGPAPRPLPADVAAKALLSALVSAALDAVVAARCVAIPLSGGLDSSAVAVAAAQAWRDLGRDSAHLRFYHLLPRSGPDEAVPARAVAAHLGHRLDEVRPPKGDPFVGDDALRVSLDFPTDGGGMAASVAMAARMRDDGVDVVLTGDGGDEVVGPTGGRLPARGAFGSSTRWLQRAAGLVVGPARRARARRRHLVGLPGWLRDHAREAGGPVSAPAARLGLSGERAARDRAIRNARQAVIVSWWRGLGEVGGFMTSHPFLDPRVADSMLALPPRTVALDRVEKGLLRRALAGRLPDAVRTRPKDQPALEGLLAEDLRLYGAGWLDRHLRGSKLEGSGLVPLAGAEESLRAAWGGDPSAIGRAMALVGLAAWCRARAVAVRWRDRT